MSAPSWQAAGAVFSGSSAAPGFAVPAGVVAGDIVTVTAFLNGTTVVTAPEAGFQLCPKQPVALGTSHSMIKYWKRATGADAGTYIFTLDGNTFIEGFAERYGSCVAAGDPWEPGGTGSASATDATLGTVSPAVSLTTVGPDRLLVHNATDWSGGSWTSPTGFSAPRVSAPVGLCTGSDKAQAVAGATGAVTATSTNSDKRIAWLGALIGTTSAGGSVELEGVAASASAAGGSLGVVRGVAGSTAGSGGGSGDLRVQRTMSGVAAAASSAKASLLTGQPVDSIELTAGSTRVVMATAGASAGAPRVM